MGNVDYIIAFQQIIMPIAYEFNPELVLVSADFSACVDDSIGKYNVSPEGLKLLVTSHISCLVWPTAK